MKLNNNEGTEMSGVEHARRRENTMTFSGDSIGSRSNSRSSDGSNKKRGIKSNTALKNKQN